MVCSNCTLLQPLSATVCSRCGNPLYSRAKTLALATSVRAPACIGLGSGVSLLACLATALTVPLAAGPALSAGACFGIVSITNMWLSVFRDEDRNWLGGMRGVVVCCVLLVSLAGEWARLQGLRVMELPSLSGSIRAPVPSALAMELIAGLLIVVDPFVVRPLIKWIEDGVDDEDPGQ